MADRLPEKFDPPSKHLSAGGIYMDYANSIIGATYVIDGSDEQMMEELIAEGILPTYEEYWQNQINNHNEHAKEKITADQKERIIQVNLQKVHVETKEKMDATIRELRSEPTRNVQKIISGLRAMAFIVYDGHQERLENLLGTIDDLSKNKGVSSE